MKKTLSWLLILMLIFSIITGCTKEVNAPETTDAVEIEPADPVFNNKFVNIGTGGTAGTYFPLGGVFAEIWNNNIKGLSATAQSTGASVANINLLIDGEVDVVIVQNDTAYYAYKGEQMFKGAAYSKLRGLATLYSEPLQIVTTDPNIKSVADLKGKNIAVGAIGSGVEANARQIIAAAGMDFEKDIHPKFLSFAEATSGLIDKQVDAAFLTAGIPTAAIQDLYAQNDVYIVAIDGDVAATLKEEYPFYTDFIIPAETYKGQMEDVQTLSVKSMLCVSANMDDDLAYALTKQIYENLDFVILAHNVGKYITKETASEAMPIEMHPGALRYFNE